jgi:hypothetical protein
MNRTSIIILISLILLAACSPASPTPTPTSAPQATAVPKPTTAPVSNQPLVSTVKAGDWSGTGENNFAISFTVGDGGNTIVKGILVTYKATCAASATNMTETLAATDSLAFSAGAFKYTNENYEVIGRAVAVDRIEGTLKADGVKIGRLGQCGTSPVTWTASPK